MEKYSPMSFVIKYQRLRSKGFGLWAPICPVVHSLFSSSEVNGSVAFGLLPFPPCFAIFRAVLITLCEV